MRSPDPLDTFLKALLAVALTLGIALAATYVPHEVCYAEPIPGSGELFTECVDEYGWMWEIDTAVATVDERPYALQLAVVASVAFLPLLFVYLRRWLS